MASLGRSFWQYLANASSSLKNLHAAGMGLERRDQGRAIDLREQQVLHMGERDRVRHEIIPCASAALGPSDGNDVLFCDAVVLENAPERRWVTLAHVSGACPSLSGQRTSAGC
jgi:hypothetical protein